MFTLPNGPAILLTEQTFPLPAYTKKKRENQSCCSSHALRLWHRLSVETNNAEAHADMQNTYPIRTEPMMADGIGTWMLHIHGRHCCLVFD